MTPELKRAIRYHENEIRKLKSEAKKLKPGRYSIWMSYDDFMKVLKSIPKEYHSPFGTIRDHLNERLVQNWMKKQSRKIK